LANDLFRTIGRHGADADGATARVRCSMR
jgi:hypothetical protein